jgi:hypothetical protein
MAEEILVQNYQKFYESIMNQGGAPLATRMLSSQLELLSKDPQLGPTEKNKSLQALGQVKINLGL